MFQTLSGPATVFLLILLAEQAGEGKSARFATEAFTQRYAISRTTRVEGTKELVERGLLRVSREALTDPTGRESVFDRKRYRNRYRLRPAARSGTAEANKLAANIAEFDLDQILTAGNDDPTQAKD